MEERSLELVTKEDVAKHNVFLFGPRRRHQKSIDPEALDLIAAEPR